MKKGLVYVFTGNGKGKTSAALGTVIRAVGNGMSVAWISWYKQKNWKLSELKPLKKMGVKVFLLGEGFSMDEKEKELIDGSIVVDKANKEKHKKAAKKAFKKANELLRKIDVLVLDEVNNTVKEELINQIDLIDLIKNRGKTHLVLTGRDVVDEVVQVADLITVMEKMKHPYDGGKLAVKGLDF